MLLVELVTSAVWDDGGGGGGVTIGQPGSGVSVVDYENEHSPLSRPLTFLCGGCMVGFQILKQRSAGVHVHRRRNCWGSYCSVLRILSWLCREGRGREVVAGIFLCYGYPWTDRADRGGAKQPLGSTGICGVVMVSWLILSPNLKPLFCGICGGFCSFASCSSLALRSVEIPRSVLYYVHTHTNT